MNGERGMAPAEATRHGPYADKFQLVNHSKFENVIPVYKYKCLRTGMTVVFGDIEGPLVSGYFTLGR